MSRINRFQKLFQQSPIPKKFSSEDSNDEHEKDNSKDSLAQKILKTEENNHNNQIQKDLTFGKKSFQDAVISRDSLTEPNKLDIDKSVKGKIDAEFFLKQSRHTVSNVKHNGGRL